MSSLFGGNSSILYGGAGRRNCVEGWATELRKRSWTVWTVQNFAWFQIMHTDSTEYCTVCTAHWPLREFCDQVPLCEFYRLFWFCACIFSRIQIAQKRTHSNESISALFSLRSFFILSNTPLRDFVSVTVTWLAVLNTSPVQNK